MSLMGGPAQAEELVWNAVRSPGPSVLREMRQLKNIISQQQPDLVILHAAKAGLAGRLAIRGSVPTIFVPHAWSFNAAKGIIAPMSVAWERLATRWCDELVCVSADELAEGRQRRIGGAMTVIDNGVDLSRYCPSDRKLARKGLNLPDSPTVVCVGRLAYQKGQDLLVRIWSKVQASVPGAQLLLVGSGPMEAALREQAGDGVHFVGPQDNIQPFLAAANVVVVPSRWEAGCLVVLEAMASGRCVVSTEVSGARRALGDTGDIIDSGSLLQLEAAIVKWLTRPELADEQGSRARAHAEEALGLEAMLVKWDELVERFLPRSGSNRDTK